MGHKPKRLLADHAHAARILLEDLAQRQIKAVISSNPPRKHPPRYNKTAYKGRNVIERMLCWLKDTLRQTCQYLSLHHPLGRNHHLMGQLSLGSSAITLTNCIYHNRQHSRL